VTGINQLSCSYLGGGFGHFFAYAPVKIRYAIDRFAMETKRQLDVLNRQLAGQTYICGEDYTIADMAIFPWYVPPALPRPQVCTMLIQPICA